ncbi:MAG TPA: lipase family protein [Chthoniobacterales bacterium]|nr:lipase family protein [Chthoniobacterales bacterium]
MSSPRKSLPMYFPSLFSLPDAVLCNELVNSAYDMYYQWKAQGYPTQPNFRWTPKGPAMTYGASIWGQTWWFPYRNEPFAFIAYSTQGNVYIVVRGSETDSDWLDDFDVRQTAYSRVSGYGKVHAGFMSIYAFLSAAVLAEINNALLRLGPNAKALYITGHSLGSGLSTLAVPDVIANSNLDRSKVRVVHYPLASPRVGDPDFYYQYSYQNIPTFRIIDTEDIVPDLPPSVVPLFGYIYKHIGLEVSYTAQYNSDAGNHDHINSYYYALKHPTQPEGPIVKQVAEAAASARFLRLKMENDLLKRLVAEREMALAVARGKPKRTPVRARKRKR